MQSAVPRAAKLARVEQFDGLANLRNAVAQLAQERGDWAGCPLPLDGEHLVVESRSRFQALASAPPAEALPAGTRIRNTFWSCHLHSDVMVYEENGRVGYGVIPGSHHLDYDLRTLGCSDAWGIEQESNALQLLATLVKHRAFKHYLLTGMFLESSARSGVTYLFRRLKPTVALTARAGKTMHILCCLCMHPLAYYQGSWAGAMCPTDDVIAALMLMRGDEHMLWKRANQHPAWTPAAGL